MKLKTKKMDYGTMTIESLADDCFRKSGYKINKADLISRITHLCENHQEQVNVNLGSVITPFWIWLVKEAKIEVIEATKFIEVHGFAEEGDFGVPVMSFAQLIDLYKIKTGL